MKDTQKALILEHLRSGQSLTALDALNRFGCFRLAARCHELRREGIAVQQEMVKRNGKAYAVYRIAPAMDGHASADLRPQGSVGGYADRS